jgi:hypothetical protein
MRDSEIVVDRALETALRRYVLGALDEPRRLEIEERLIGDPATFDRLGVIEQELTEEYLEGALSGADAQGYERHFLATPDHQRQLAFIRGLRETAVRTAADREAPSSPGLFARVRELLQLEPLLVGVPSCALIVLTGLAAWSWTSHRQLTTELTALRTDYARELQRRAVSSVVIQPAPVQSASPQPAPTSLAPTQSAPVRLLLPGIPTFALMGSLSRGEGALTRISYAVGAQAVRFQLDTPTTSHESYRVVLYDGNADERCAISGLHPTRQDGRQVVTVVLPSDLLPAGDYQLKVFGVNASGPPDSLATYTIRTRVR